MNTNKYKIRPMDASSIKRGSVSQLISMGVTQRLIDMALMPPYSNSPLSFVLLVLTDDALKGNDFFEKVEVFDNYIKIGRSFVEGHILASSFATLGHLLEYGHIINVDNMMTHLITDLPGHWLTYVPCAFRGSNRSSPEIAILESFVEILYDNAECKDVHVITPVVYPSMLTLYRNLLDDVGMDNVRLHIHSDCLGNKKMTEVLSTSNDMCTIKEGIVLDCRNRAIVNPPPHYLMHDKYVEPVEVYHSGKCYEGLHIASNRYATIHPVTRCLCRLCYFVERTVSLLMLSDSQALEFRSYIYMSVGHSLMGDSGDYHEILMVEYNNYLNREDSNKNIKVIIKERLSTVAIQEEGIVRFLSEGDIVPHINIEDCDYMIQFDTPSIARVLKFLNCHTLPKKIKGDVYKLPRSVSRSYNKTDQNDIFVLVAHEQRKIAKVTKYKSDKVYLAGALIARRLKSGGFDYLFLRHKGGGLTIPKGHIKDGERPLDCMYREVFEETGLNLRKNKLYARLEMEYIDNKVAHQMIVYQYNVRGADHITLGKEFIGYVWKKKKEIFRIGHYVLLREQMSDPSVEEMSPKMAVALALRKVMKVCDIIVPLSLEHSVIIEEEQINITVMDGEDNDVVVHFIGKKRGFECKIPKTHTGNTSIVAKNIILDLNQRLNNKIIGIT